MNVEAAGGGGPGGAPPSHNNNSNSLLLPDLHTVAAAAAVAAAREEQQQQQRMCAGQKLMRRGFQQELLEQAKILCDRQDYVDLNIYCEDGVVRAHQMLLAVASPFLKVLFQTSPMYGVDEISIILPEVKACLVQALIHFVYTGTVVSKEDHFYSLMKLVYALNINASIEAEGTDEKATIFSAPLVTPPSLRQHEVESLKLHQHLPLHLSQPQQHQQQHHQQQQQQQQHQQSLQMAMPSLPIMPLLPTQPNPPTGPPSAKMARMANVQQQQQHQQLHLQQHQQHKLPIQLPQTPVPLVNGMTPSLPTHPIKPEGVSFISIDPSLSYKVEVPNGQQHVPLTTVPASSAVAAVTGNAAVASQQQSSDDPLAAIMNETIFTETSGGAHTMYTTENGQIVYATASTMMTQVTPVTTGTTAATTINTVGGGQGANNNKKRGKKRNGKENAILAESVDDLPCAPDDDDINTPYSCDSCNKTIKGRVMLQAHHYQEHYVNPEMDRMAIGDKHACRVCLKLFTRNSDVKAHILRVHCGDRRYPCTMCGKRFKESTHLRKHLYTHTGERPHYCTLCNKGFQTSSDLKRHKRTRVHQERVEGSRMAAPPGEGGATENVAAAAAPAPASAAGGGGGTTTSAAASGGGGGGNNNTGQFNRWEEEEDDGSPVNLNTATTTGPPTTSTTNTIDTTAQALLNNITQPLAPQAQPVLTVASSTWATTAGTPSSTIDMKAIGNTTWNSNQLPPTSVQQQQQQQQQPPATSSASSSSGSTLDLKAIAGGSTVDINALKWQQQQQPLQQQQQQQQQQSGQQQQQQQQDRNGDVVKRSSSVDSPVQDEERLTVVENDDSSQDLSME